MSKKNIFIIIIAVLIIAIFAYSKWSSFSLNKQINIPASAEAKSVTFAVKPGESLSMIAKNLKDNGLITDENTFIRYSKKGDLDKKIKAGDYTLNTNMTPKKVLEALVSGQRSEIWITIPEGWRISQIAQYLEKEGIAKALTFKDTAKVKNFASTPFLANLSGNTSLEGYLFPDTYKVFADASVEDIIQVMLDGFGNKVDKKIMDGANKKGFTLHQFITLTSIVEKESAHSEDIRKIASVYYNRLNQDMLFQSDATITYITERPDARPSIDETKTDSPYNTYLYKGLPPGPVGNPGLAAIEATLNPDNTDYLFFVSKGDRAYFAKTYEEHLLNIEKYLD